MVDNNNLNEHDYNNTYFADDQEPAEAEDHNAHANIDMDVDVVDQGEGNEEEYTDGPVAEAPAEQEQAAGPLPTPFEEYDSDADYAMAEEDADWEAEAGDWVQIPPPIINAAPDMPQLLNMAGDVHPGPGPRTRNAKIARLTDARDQARKALTRVQKQLERRRDRDSEADRDVKTELLRGGVEPNPGPPKTWTGGLETKKNRLHAYLKRSTPALTLSDIATAEHVTEAVVNRGLRMVGEGKGGPQIVSAL